MSQNAVLLIAILVVAIWFWAKSRRFKVGDRVALKGNLAETGVITGQPGPDAYDVLFDSGTQSIVPGDALVRI